MSRELSDAEYAEAVHLCRSVVDAATSNDGGPTVAGSFLGKLRGLLGRTAAPEPGTQDLAEKVARSLHERLGSYTPWEELHPAERGRLCLRAAESLLNVEKAGLTVVELPEPDSWDGGTDPRWQSSDDGADVIAAAALSGRLLVELERGLQVLTPGEAHDLAARILAAVSWAEYQGGDPR